MTALSRCRVLILAVGLRVTGAVVLAAPHEVSSLRCGNHHRDQAERTRPRVPVSPDGVVLASPSHRHAPDLTTSWQMTAKRKRKHDDG